jgi:hypothetical protein
MSDLFTQFPDEVSFQAVSFQVNTPTQSTETFSGKTRRVGMGISYYSWEVRYPNLLPIDAGTVNGFVAQAFGPQFSFEIILPEISYSKAPSQTNTVPRTSANASIGATSVTLANCGVSKNVLAAGDFFKFANHSKVYMCVSPCVSNSSGVATLFFSCPLITAVPNPTNLTITAVPFTAILTEDVQKFDVGFGGITTMSLAMREVF